MNTPYELPSELTIYSAAETRDALLGWLSAQPQADQPLRLAAARVHEVDAAGLQLLCAFAATVAAKGWTLIVESPSDAFAAACRTLGMSVLLDKTADDEVSA